MDIEELKEAIKILTKKVDNWKYERPSNPITFNGIIDEIDKENNAIETILTMLKEKDKIINLLINKLNQNYNKVFEKCEITEMIKIYGEIKNKTNLGGIELRKECIKRYFENKVKEDK